jgi:VanZ family protein
MPASRALSLWLPVIVWAAVIFTLSSIPSLGTGLGVWDTVLRKAGHMTEFAILGALLFRALSRELPAFVAGAAYAVTDEVHQHFVEGRHASALDVALDAVGVTLGIVLLRLFQTRQGDRPRAMAVGDIPPQIERSGQMDVSETATTEGQSPGQGR